MIQPKINIRISQENLDMLTFYEEMYGIKKSKFIGDLLDHFRRSLEEVSSDGSDNS